MRTPLYSLFARNAAVGGERYSDVPKVATRFVICAALKPCVTINIADVWAPGRHVWITEPRRTAINLPRSSSTIGSRGSWGWFDDNQIESYGSYPTWWMPISNHPIRMPRFGVSILPIYAAPIG